MHALGSLCFGGESSGALIHHKDAEITEQARRKTVAVLTLAIRVGVAIQRLIVYASVSDLVLLWYAEFPASRDLPTLDAQSHLIPTQRLGAWRLHNSNPSK